MTSSQVLYPELELLSGVREKSETNDFPDSFRGTPAVLMTACLMSIAFYGFGMLA